MPDDLEDGTEYIAVPRARDLDLGSRLALDFVHETLPSEYHVVAGFFRRPGAYRKFKVFLERAHELAAWYQYEADAVAKALRTWVVENELPISLGPDKSVA